MRIYQRAVNFYARQSAQAGPLTIDHIWALTALALIWLFLSVAPLPPNDLWWHMAAGRVMIGEGSLITTNRWAYTLPADTPYVYQSWLSEIFMYLLWRVGDVPLLTLARTVAITASYGLVAWHAWRRVGNGKVVTIALLLAVMTGWSNWTLRPQTLALLPGAAFAVVLGEYLIGRAAPRRLLALPALMAIWVNMHGSFVLGIALIGAAWLGTALAAARGAGEQRGRLGALSLAAALTLGATLLNPLGPGIIGYVRAMLTNGSLQKWFIEWQPPRNTLSVFDNGFWFYATVLLLAALMAAGPRRPSALDLLMYGGLSWLGFSGTRYVMWYGLLLMPLLAQALGPLLRQRQPAAGSPAVNAVFALLLAGAIVATLPWFTPAAYLGPGSEELYATSGPYRMLLANTTPIAAAEWLARNPVDGHFWTDMSYTSYTIWRLPDKQVFADLRVELFPQSVWEDYFAISRGDDRSLAMLDRWRITHVLLDRGYQKVLYAFLKRTPGWCERYADRNAVILVRCR